MQLRTRLLSTSVALAIAAAIGPAQSGSLAVSPTLGSTSLAPLNASDTTRLSYALSSVERDVQILNKKLITLPLLKSELTVYKVLNVRTGDSYTLAFDSSGAQVNYEASLAEESTLRYKMYGSMQPALNELIQRDPSTPRLVMIKMNVPEPARLNKVELEGKDAEAMAQQAAEIEAAMRKRSAEVLRSAMAEMKLGLPEKLSQSGPFVSILLTPDAIQRLAYDSRVAFIGLDGEKEIYDYPTIPQSLPTTRTNSAHSLGYKGDNIRIAILESGGLTEPQACFNIAAVQDGSASGNSHMTKSAGIIGNRYNAGLCNGSWQGYAPNASVYIANVSSYTSRYDWAKSNSADVLTMSWHFGSEETDGGLHSRDVYFDYVTTHYPWPSAFTSAGNQAPSAYASGKGYNFFGVANIDNDGDGNRCNDSINSSSTYKDPISPHSDREVPAIATPGSRHDLLGSSFGGTSAATPVAASIAAVLMSANPSLKVWPEGIRAIMLATANYQNGDGANFSVAADGKDGTGLVNTQYGYWTANRRETGTTAQYRAHDYGYFSASDFSGGFFTKSWKVKTGTTNSRIRVAFTWNSKTEADGSGNPVSSVLDGDMDVWIYSPSGSLVAWSASWDNSFEFVEFTPSVAGEYTIKVRGYSVPAGFSSYYGVAFTTHYDLCS